MVATIWEWFYIAVIRIYHGISNTTPTLEWFLGWCIVSTNHHTLELVQYMGLKPSKCCLVAPGQPISLMAFQTSGFLWKYAPNYAMLPSFIIIMCPIEKQMVYPSDSDWSGSSDPIWLNPMIVLWCWKWTQSYAIPMISKTVGTLEN